MFHFVSPKINGGAERGKINTSFGTERYGWLRGCDGWLRERQIDKEGAMCARKFGMSAEDIAALRRIERAPSR